LSEARKQPTSDGWQLATLSCFRSINYQAVVFCSHDDLTKAELKGGKDCVDRNKRALSSAPPGFSEHATGFALDFTVRSIAGNRSIDCKPEKPPCEKEMSTTIGKWLLKNAGCFGFELSFPGDLGDATRRTNEQGVMYEPWHWRWVGTDASTDAAKLARGMFADARIWYPNKAPPCPAK
ncbi:MAG: M15 family metallopeptidase, partial [Sphingomonas sp.]|nr:M15 family metallopeptidase [Sphingomonas sp.]